MKRSLLKPGFISSQFTKTRRRRCDVIAIPTSGPLAMDQSSARVESRVRLRQKHAKCRAAAQEWRGVFETGVYR